MKTKENLKWNLQFFNDGGADAGANDTGTNPAGANTEPKSFDDILKDKAYQSEFDKRISKALETAKSKWESDKAKELEAAKSEAEKLAKMNAEQKAEHERQKKEAEFSRRESELTRRELTQTAKEIMIEKGLDLSLIDFLNYESADTVKASIDTLEKTFKEAVQKGVDERFKGTTPKRGNAPTSQSEMEAQVNSVF